MAKKGILSGILALVLAVACLGGCGKKTVEPRQFVKNEDGSF